MTLLAAAGLALIVRALNNDSGIHGQLHFVARMAQIDRDQLCDRVFVFDDEDRAHLQRTAFSTSSIEVWRTSVPFTT